MAYRGSSATIHQQGCSNYENVTSMSQSLNVINCTEPSKTKCQMEIMQ